MENPFNFFDKVYCINLNERTDRWKKCLDKFKKYDIKHFERVEAVKKNISPDKKINGRYGCTASWEKSLRKIINDDVQSALIFEDDFEFRFEKDELFKKINNSISELPSGWDMLYLGGLLIDKEFNPPIKSYSKNLYKLISCYSTHSIAISKKGANKILEYFKHDWTDNVLKSCDVIDVFFARKITHNLECFISNELLCFQEAGQSDIENGYLDVQDYFVEVFESQKTKLLDLKK